MDQATEQPMDRSVHVVRGPIRSGKTTALLAEACALASAGHPVLFLAATSVAAQRIREQVLRQSPATATRMRITTCSGWAEEIVRRAAPQLRIISASPARTALRRFLATESASPNCRELWPTFHEQLQSEIRQQEVIVAASEFRASGLTIEQILERTSLFDTEAQRWTELAEFVVRWTKSMSDQNLVDPLGVLTRASQILHSGQREFWRKTYPHVFVDDVERLGPLSAQVATTHGSELTLSVDPDGPSWKSTTDQTSAEQLQTKFAKTMVRDLAAPTDEVAKREITVLTHPSLEADAIISALAIQHEAGTPWSEMSVALAFNDLSLHASLSRTARRLGVPLSGQMLEPKENLWATAVCELITAPTECTPTQQRIGIQLDEVTRDSLGQQRNLARRAHLVWKTIGRQTLAEADDDSVQLVSAVINRVAKDVSPQDALTNPVTLSGEGVFVCLASQLAGESCDVVVIAQAVEGVWPDPGTLGIPTFDPELLTGGEPPDVPTRRHRWVGEQAKRFDATVAVARKRVLAVAAPRPGVLVSRFAETWDRTAIKAITPTLRKQIRSAPTETENPVACFPSGKLRLSASQLDTFENCALSFAYQYVAGIRGEGSVSASVGTMVHATLEAFLSPEGQINENVTVEDLLTQLDACWDSTAFPYRPQEADYRRRAEEWLRNWFTTELPRLGKVIAVEHRFSIDVGPHELTGSIDRISSTKTGVIEIVDYKTGARPSGSIDEENLQLASYYLAARTDPFLRSFGEPERLRLHYLVDGKDIDQPITPNHVEVTTGRILLNADKILTEHYEPAIDAECEYCSFQRICPIQKEGREVPTVPFSTNSRPDNPR